LIKYIAIAKAGFIGILAYRASAFLVSLTNLFYVAIIYFLWKAVYADSEVINGMTFGQTFTYLALASTLFNVYYTFTEWKMSAEVVSGNILMDIVRPVDYQAKMFFTAVAAVLFRLLWVGFPAIVLVTFLGGGDFFVLKNLAYFLLAFVSAYIAGLSAFYTESIWGICLTKESVVMLLSGAVVPVAFFPESMRPIIEWTPFHHIYNTPLTILTSKDLGQGECLQMLTAQFVWIWIIYFITRFSHKIAVRQVTINGG
jgi:ABC-2 type transport system permease protein